MQLSAIIEKEKQRGTLFECRIARLYREGMFLRAYNWSAWLFVKHSPDLKISNRQTKSSEGVVTMIGFPPQSIEKFAPEGAQVATNTDGSVDVVFPSSIIPDDADPQALAAEYDEWKASLPVADSRPSKKGKEQDPFSESNAGSAPQPPGIMPLTSIMQRIMAYPVESKSPMESMLFLSEIRRQLSALI